jgi:hypothetical protein
MQDTEYRVQKQIEDSDKTYIDTRMKTQANDFDKKKTIRQNCAPDNIASK